MKPEDIFFDGITHIREDLIEEAQRFVFRRRVKWQQYAGFAAACLALVLGIHLLLHNGGTSGSYSGSNSYPSGDTAPSLDSGLGTKEFTANVLEITEDGSLIVVPQPGSGIWSVADRVTVPVFDLPEMPDVQPGDRILVVYAGEAERDFVQNVVEIIRID